MDDLQVALGSALVVVLVIVGIRCIRFSPRLRASRSKRRCEMWWNAISKSESMPSGREIRLGSILCWRDEEVLVFRVPGAGMAASWLWLEETAKELGRQTSKASR